MKSLKMKLLLYILIPTAALFSAAFTIVGYLSAEALIGYARETAKLQAEKGRGQIETGFGSPMVLLEDAVNTVEVMYGWPMKDRGILPELFGNYLKDYDSVFSLWVYFKPDGWDGRDADFADTEDYDETGNYAVWAYREESGGGITVSTEAWGVEAYEDEYYAVPFSTPGLYLTEPYEEEISEGYSVKMVSLSEAVYGENGEVIGVAGIDFSLDFLNDLTAGLDERSEGFSAIISSYGEKIAGSLPEELIDTSSFSQEIDAVSASSEVSEAGNEPVPGNSEGFEASGMITMAAPIYLDEDLPLWTLLVSMPGSEIMKVPLRIITYMAMMLVGSLIILAVFIITISGRITSPLVSLTSVFDTISSGDLRPEVNINGRDETGRLAAGFNNLTGSLNIHLSAVKESMDNLKINADELRSGMERTRGHFSSIAESITNVIMKGSDNTRGISGAGESVDKIKASIKELDANIDKQTSMLLESFSAIEEMLASINSVADVVTRSSGYYRDLNESSVKGEYVLNEVISQINDIYSKSSDLLETNTVIANIASQTNLLSMNAAIEAAHAGDAGKGFAVVADEIRKLSEDTREQSRAIEQILQKIADTIKSIAESSAEAGENFGGIQSLINTVSGLEAEIKNSLQEQSAGSRQILTSLDDMKKSTQHVKDESTSIAVSIDSLSEEIAQLSQNSSAIQESIGKVFADNEEIKKAVEMAGNLTERNNHQVDEANSNLSVFRLR